MFFLGCLQLFILLLLYFFSRDVALTVALLAPLFPFAMEFPWKVSVLLGVGSLSAFWVGIHFQKMESAFLKEHQTIQTHAEGYCRQKQLDVEKKKATNLTLEQRAGEIVALYELTKEVTTSLELSELLLLLQATLRGTLSFQRGWLSLVSEKEKVVMPGGCFQFSHSEPLPFEKMSVSEVPPFLEGAVRETARLKRPLHLEKGNVAIPLLVKNELNGVLVLEGFSTIQEENLLILAGQFAPAVQKVRLYEKIQQLAITDGLTRLFTRHYFLERFQEELSRSKRFRLSLTILMADIDHFKVVNDRCGHLVGDVVLREVASLIKANVREIDLAGRYGGEEFAIVLPDTPMEGALQVSERIRAAIDSHQFVAYDEVLHVTISLGIGVYPENGADPTSLIDAADAALYHAKRGGRNRISTSRMLV